jgi:protein phosphatase methylesterase 1
VVHFNDNRLGETVASNPDDLSEQTLTNDAVLLIKHLFAGKKCKIVLVGHSMGGAIAAKVAGKNEIPSLCGLVVVDVVEGTALAALPSMEAILNERPKQFPSVEAAIQWR